MRSLYLLIIEANIKLVKGFVFKNILDLRGLIVWVATLALLYTTDMHTADLLKDTSPNPWLNASFSNINRILLFEFFITK